jgi:hypothetical protein
MCEKCNKRQPRYNKSEEKEAIYCGDCKDPDMVNVINKKCYKCKNKQPNFNKVGETNALFCGDCKEPDMVNITIKVCSYLDCKNNAYYGFPGNKIETCYQHRQDGFIRRPKKICLEKHCKQMAIYGYTTAKHCEEHKYEDEIDLIQHKCKACGLIEVVNKEGYCYCKDEELFKRVRLAKQKTVKNYLDRHFELKYISYDKQIDYGICGKERPDFLFDCKSFYLVLEVDEDQHEQRNCECEQVRMINISQSLGMPTLFLRFNPDKYKLNKGDKMYSERKRLESLVDVLNYYKDKSTDLFENKGFSLVTYMFYDEDKKTQWLKPIKLL